MRRSGRSLCNALDRGDLLEDARFKTRADRMENDDSLVEELQKAFVTRLPREWEESLIAAGVACVEVEDSGMFNFFSQDPHVEENGFIRPANNPRIGDYWRYSPMVELSRTPTRVGSGPLRGQHTRSILEEIGYSNEEIETLYSNRIVDSEEPTVWGEAGH